MRYPDTPFMKRTFDMVRNRGLKLTLIPYILQMVSPMTNTWLFFNNARVNNQAASVTQDPFGISGFVDDPTISTPEGASRKVAEVLQPFRDLFRTSADGKPADIAASMKIVFEQTNNFSMRSYMLQALGMSTEDINWCETTDKSTGWYDRAFTESKLLGVLHGFHVVTSECISDSRKFGLQLARYSSSGPRATEGKPEPGLVVLRVRVGRL